jgi:ParB family chromosome partitioning protein
MTTNKGLGKGLGALISMFEEEEDNIVPRGTIEKTMTAMHNERGHQNVPLNGLAAQATAQPYAPNSSGHGTIEAGVTEIPLDLIDNNKNQPRKVFDETELRELEQSIAANGVLQPILVNKVGSRYMVVAGERRWRASKNLGLATIPALVREYSPKQIAEIALVENLMRADLNEIEIAEGIKQLMDKHDMTQEQVSRVLGMNRSSLANYLRYLNLPAVVREMLGNKTITAGHAKILCGIADREQCLLLAKKCATGMMTVRALELAAAGSTTTKPSPDRPLELKKLEKDLVQKFASRVKVEGTESTGRIIFTYKNARELETLAKSLLK